MPNTLAIEEARLRRVAKRRGLVFRKSKRRDPDSIDFGAYWLINATTGALVWGEQRGGPLSQASEFLDDYRPPRSADAA